MLLIFCVQKISSIAYLQKFTSHSKWPFCLRTSCEHFAGDIIIITPKTITNELKNDVLHPFVAISNFFSCGQRSILAMSNINDPIIIELYETAQSIIENSQQYERSNESKLSAFRFLCRSMSEQYLRVMETIH